MPPGARKSAPSARSWHGPGAGGGADQGVAAGKRGGPRAAEERAIPSTLAAVQARGWPRLAHDKGAAQARPAPGYLQPQSRACLVVVCGFPLRMRVGRR